MRSNRRLLVFINQPHSWVHGPAVATSISIPRSAAAAEGRDPQSTATEGSDRPKAAIDGGRRSASGLVEPAEHEPVQPIHSGKESPLRPALVYFAACMPPATPCCFSAAPYAMPWRLCDLSKYRAALTNNRNRFLSPTSVRYFWAQDQQPFPGASLSAAPSPETLIPPLSLPLPRLPSHVHSNTCRERPVPPLPFTSPGTSTSTSAGIGNVGGGGDDGGGGGDDDDG